MWREHHKSNRSTANYTNFWCSSTGMDSGERRGQNHWPALAMVMATDPHKQSYGRLLPHPFSSVMWLSRVLGDRCWEFQRVVLTTVAKLGFATKWVLALKRFPRITRAILLHSLLSVEHQDWSVCERGLIFDGFFQPWSSCVSPNFAEAHSCLLCLGPQTNCARTPWSVRHFTY